MFVAGEDAQPRWALPFPEQLASKASPGRETAPRGSAAPTGLSRRLPSQTHLLSVPFNKAGLHRVPAVPLTGDAAPWPWGTAAPQRPGEQPCPGTGNCAGPRTQRGFAQSQMAVALGKTLFPDGHQGWPVNLPSKENGDFSANSLAGPAAVFPPVCPLLPWQLTHHSIANSTEMGLEQNEASHTMFSCCCRAGCGTRREQHQGQCWRTHPGPSAAARADEGPRLYKPLACRHTALGGIKYLQHCSQGIYIYGHICIYGGLAAELH